jgi:hypothetical protein
MSKRKPNNPHARLERFSRSVLRQNHVAVVNIDPSNKQGLINWKNAKSIAKGRHIADAICDIAHYWTIYLAALCVDQFGKHYIKSVEVAPQGMYLSGHLTDVIDTTYRDLIAGCNCEHVVASGWIAIPDRVSLEEEQAARIFDAVGAWGQERAA